MNTPNNTASVRELLEGARDSLRIYEEMDPVGGDGDPCAVHEASTRTVHDSRPSKPGFAWYDGTPLSNGKWQMVEIFRPCWVDATRQDLAWRYLDRSAPDDITQNLITNCAGRFVPMPEPSTQ